MNVAMIVASFPPLPSGGAELQALNLGEKLSNKGIRVSFLTPGKTNLKGLTNLNGMAVHRLFSFPNRLFDFFSELKKKRNTKPIRIEYSDAQEITDALTGKIRWPTLVYYHVFFFNCLWFLWPRRRSFDIIHAHTMEWSAIVAARLGKVLRKPVIIKDSTMNGFRSIRRFPMGERLQKMIIQESAFIAMTESIAENLKNAGIPSNKIFRIPNGIDISQSGNGFRVQFEDPIVLFVGNLYQQPAKGIDILLNAWCRVTKEYPDAHLKIIGEGNLPAFRQFAESLGISRSVQFLGKQSDLSWHYNAASLFVLPSRREGMSNALMEAMLHGLPCVATNISGNQDLIDSGSCGILVPAKDPDRLASGICYMIAHPEEASRMGEKAREKIIRKYNMDIIANQYVSLYNDLLNHEIG
jgi:glycosyltransferase involved in cell wall biosynthesis